MVTVEVAADTLQKALRINLDPRWYGTIAEIGAGQEVARWFFRAGGAAGTVAKTISAYDMAVSDAVYGRSGRYVSSQRLQAMLDHEFQLNMERLDDSRGDANAFFAFADTVVARSYQGGNECHGWIGVKFQSHVRDEPSQIVLHVRMLDAEAALQQEALGVVGVNLLYGAFFHHHEPEIMIESLLDRLTIGRIEIDMIQFKGIEFRSVDNRLMALKLVQLGLSGVAMFGPDGDVLQPSEVLRKRDDPGRAGQLPAADAGEHRHARVGGGEVRPGPGGDGLRAAAAHRADDGQPDGHRDQRHGQPARLPGPRRPARGVRDDHADQRLRRIPPAGRSISSSAPPAGSGS